jgi:hypothetical protein
MSKILKDFQKRRNSPSGDLIELQKTRVISNWSNFKYCIQNKLPIYALADTQSGKTFFKFLLADQALNDGVADNVIISTTNLTGAMTQICDRAIEWGKSIGRQVKSTSDKSAYMVKGDIFINMTNANRTNRIDTIVEDAEKTAKKYKRPSPKILVILDEGEEFHELTETSQCDTALGNLLIHNKHNISVVKVSATLLSHMLIHGQFSSDLGFLTKEQIYQIPNHPDYKGLNIPYFIEPELKSEQHFSGDCYTKKANLRNTSNIKIVVDQVELLISNQKKIGDDAKTKSLVQIGNVVFGRMRSGHLKVAGMFIKSFQNKGRSVTLWDDEEFNQLSNSAEVVIVIHNGQARDLTVAEKLTKIAHGWDRSKLKAIIIISKMMTGKSITVECERWYDPNSREFGFYANFTAYYGPGKENITTAIQAMRCTGIRPALKKHVMWTTDDTKQDIENYRDQITRFISHLNRVGSMDRTQIIEWVAGTRPITKSKVQKGFVGNIGVKKRAGDTITDAERLDFISKGVPTLDQVYQVPMSVYNTIGQDRDKMFQHIQKLGFVVLVSTAIPTLRQPIVNPAATDIMSYTSGAAPGAKIKDWVVMQWFKKGNKMFLWCSNKSAQGKSNPDEYLAYSIRLDEFTHQPIFTPKIHHKRDSMVYKVL